MNKYHYEALVDLIITCTAVIVSGILLGQEQTIASYGFLAYATLKAFSFIRNETKAKKEAQ